MSKFRLGRLKKKKSRKLMHYNPLNRSVCDSKPVTYVAIAIEMQGQGSGVRVRVGPMSRSGSGEIINFRGLNT